MIKKIMNVWYFILFILISFLVISYFLEVPNSLKGEGILMNNNVIDYNSEREGVISEIKKDNSIVKKGEVLLAYNSQADLKSILHLENLVSLNISSNINNEELYKVYRNISNTKFDNLGEVYSFFIEFKTQLNKFFTFKNSKITHYEVSSLQNKINLNIKNKKIDNRILQEVKDKLESNKSLYINDSILFTQKLITIDEFNNSKGAYLQAKTNFNNIYKQQNIEHNVNSILSNEKNKINESNYINTNIEYNNVIEKYIQLLRSLQEWKNKNLIVSPIDGKIKYYRFWKKNEFVNKGEQLFAIQNDNASQDIEIKINVEGAGKIINGQECLIEFKEFPSKDYGLLKGKVKNVIHLKHKDKNENYSTYIKISLINNGITNQGNKIQMSYTMPVTAEIIIENEKLFNKIFKRIKKEFKKQN
ncbi:HlyD family efflux transporter periplasmic adaptor subunit [Empedobacter falsenii]